MRKAIAVTQAARHIGLSTNIMSRAAAMMSIGIHLKMVLSVLVMVLSVRSISEAINSVRLSLYASGNAFNRV